MAVGFQMIGLKNRGVVKKNGLFWHMALGSTIYVHFNVHENQLFGKVSLKNQGIKIL